MKKTINIGIIGCGGIAVRHVNWFLAHDRCQIAAVCDISADSTKELKKLILEQRPQTAVFTTEDYHEILAAPQVDAVAVLLPHSLHYPVVTEALQAGKHVLVEKPMVIESRHAQELIKLSEQYDKILAIAYQRSCLSEYEYVRQMVASGEFGDIRFVSAHLEQSWFANFTAGPGESWRGNPASVGGGQLVDTGSHTVAALLDVTQLIPVEVFAFIANCGLAVDVNTAASVRFSNGAVGSLTIGGFGHLVTEVLRIVSDKHSARILFRTVNEQLLEIDGKIIDAKEAVPSTTPNANFIDAILGNTQVRATPQLGLRVAQLSEAVYLSAEKQEPVKIKSN